MAPDKSYITVCMWCGLVLRQGRDNKIQENWERVHKRLLDKYTLSHGVCPSCTEAMWEEDRTRGRK